VRVAYWSIKLRAWLIKLFSKRRRRAFWVRYWESQGSPESPFPDDQVGAEEADVHGHLAKLAS
jgi:hypothetical protein